MLKKFLMIVAFGLSLLSFCSSGVEVGVSTPLTLAAAIAPTTPATLLTLTSTLTGTANMSQATTTRWEVFTNANCVRDVVIVGNTLWAGTCGGVVQWDIPTSTYQKYTTADGLLHNVIDHIAADASGQVWINYELGIDSARLKALGHFDGERWTNITERGLNQPLKKVNDLVIDQSGRVWLAYQWTHTPLAMFDGQSWTTFGQADGLPPLPAQHLLADRSGRIWAIVGPVVAMYDGVVWQTYSPEETGLSIPITALSQDGLGRIWFSSSAGFSRFDGQIWEQIPAYDDNQAYRIVADEQGNMWTPTEPGVLRRFDGQSWQSYTVEDSLPSTAVLSLALDEAGRLWLTSYNNFATVFDGQKATTLDIDDFLPDNEISDLDISPNGDVWVIADGWLTQISATPDGEHRATVHSEVGQLTRALRVILDHDSQGRTWAVTNFGVVFYNGQEWRGYRDINGVVYNITSLLVDSADRIWLKISGTNADLAMLDEDGWHVYEAPLGWTTWRVVDMVEGPDGDIWLGNLDGGISRFDGQTWTFLPYEEISPAIDDNIHQLTLDPQGRLWLARGYDFAPGGVWVDDGNTVTQYGLRDGLVEERITALTSDQAGNVWIGYSNVIGDHVYAASYFDGNTWHTYTLPHGLAGIKVNEIAVDAEGRVWFATSNGLSLFDPNLPRPATELAPLQLKAQPYARALLVGPGTPPRLYALWTDDFEATIITSDDSGVTWQAFSGGVPPCPHNLNLDYATEDTLYASTCEGLYRWDGGEWQQISSEETEMVAVVYGQPNQIWAAQRVGQPLETPVLFSNNGGEAWQPASRYLEHTQGVRQLGLHPQDPNLLFATVWPTGEGSYLRRGTGDGQWETLPTPLDNAAIEPYFILDGPTMYLATAAPDSQLWRSDNLGNPAANLTWEVAHNFAERTQVTLLAAGPRDTFYANFFDDTVAAVPQLHRSEDGGQQWEPIAMDFTLE